MGFGGGPDRVIVNYADDTEGPFYEATSGDPVENDDRVTVRVGGQDVALPEHHLIGLEDAIAAAVAFIATGARPRSLDWQPC